MNIDEKRKQFEETELFKRYDDIFNIYYKDFGGYTFRSDDKTCYYLNGAFVMFQEINK